MRRRVVVTGMGALSALGSGVDALWLAALEGRSGIRRLPRLEQAGLPACAGGEVADVSLDDPQRHVSIARHAIEQALANAGGLDPATSGFCWSTGLDEFTTVRGTLDRRPSGGWFAALARQFRPPRRMIATACASGSQAIGEAFRLIRSGGTEVCVAGGSSTMLSPFYVIGFAGLQALALDRDNEDPASYCRPFDRNRRGFVLGDGAGALVLETLASATRRGATILAELLGYGTSQDAFDLNRPSPDGKGAELCMRRALEDAEVDPDALGAINAHGTGTILGDKSEAAAIRSMLGSRWKAVPVSSMKGAIGHTQAAAGALEAIVAVRSCAEVLVPPTANLRMPDDECELNHVMERPRPVAVPTVLSSSFGMGGQNAAVVFSRFGG